MVQTGTEMIMVDHVAGSTALGLDFNLMAHSYHQELTLAMQALRLRPIVAVAWWSLLPRPQPHRHVLTVLPLAQNKLLFLGRR